MEFEWDETKDRRTLQQRGFGFDFAIRVFSDPKRIDRADSRHGYGEDRRQTIGRIDGKIYFVAYTMRGTIVRIISARRAHDKEEEHYKSTSC